MAHLWMTQSTRPGVFSSFWPGDTQVWVEYPRSDLLPTRRDLCLVPNERNGQQKKEPDSWILTISSFIQDTTSGRSSQGQQTFWRPEIWNLRTQRESCLSTGEPSSSLTGWGKYQAKRGNTESGRTESSIWLSRPVQSSWAGEGNWTKEEAPQSKDSSLLFLVFLDQASLKMKLYLKERMHQSW